ncbi:MAG: hypothetical protein KDK66_00810 [Deltaproteobacteria bacterium]|nr:hypothetical protein [Deltaproteobacteria bacterium]
MSVMVRKVKGTKGFTLIEGLFAVLILSFGLIGLVSIFTEMNRNSVNTALTLSASHLVSQTLEDYLAVKAQQGYGAISVGQSSNDIVLNNQTYTIETDVYYVESGDLSTPSVSDTGYKMVEVSANWNVGGPQQVSQSTIFTNY